MQTWIATAILFSLVALHNAQRMAPVTLFDELRLRLATSSVLTFSPTHYLTSLQAYWQTGLTTSI